MPKKRTPVPGTLLPATGNPLPTTLPGALAEIARLQRQLVLANQKLAERWGNLAIAGRSLRAQLERLRKECQCGATVGTR